MAYRFRHETGRVVWGQLEGFADGARLPTSLAAIMGSRFHPAEFRGEKGRFDVAYGHTFAPSGRVLAPVEACPAVWAAGLNYMKHAEETGLEPPRLPTLFLKGTNAITGPFDPIETPAVCKDEMDYEGELAIVIGRPCKDVLPENALDYVLGMCAANDVTARRWQGIKQSKQWSRSKSFDSFLPLGPALVPPGMLPGSGQDVRITTTFTRGGVAQVVQDSSTSDMIFSIAELISFMSQGTTLLPWTIILTGTPEGVGFTRDPPMYLQPTDRVDVSLEGIGTLSNAIL